LSEILTLQKSDSEEHPRAYVVLQPSVPATPEMAKRITDSVAAKVSRHKRITGGVVFVDALPKNPSGKILRRLLRERAQKEVKEEGHRARL
jgi:4-coumarate--CoA ligase